MSNDLELAMAVVTEALEACHRTIEAASETVSELSKQTDIEVSMASWVRLRDAMGRTETDLLRLKAFYYVDRVENGKRYGPRANARRSSQAEGQGEPR